MFVKQVLAFDIGSAVGIRFSTPASLVSTIVANAYGLLGIIFLVLIIAGGWGVIMGAGSGDKDKFENGRKAISAAIIGLLVVFLSYFVVRVIEVITGASLLSF